MASGSFDTTLKIWGAQLEGAAGGEQSNAEGNADGSKRARKTAAALTRKVDTFVSNRQNG